ncbi:MAG: hypothetical protein ABF274_08235 [Nonlabens sp.]|uniref:hypothetical protein n=1 Tax=Nonlabens sp. TaxID=1888209 RepID=UPI00321A635F
MSKRVFTFLLFISVILLSCEKTTDKIFDFGSSTFSATVYSQNKKGIEFSIAKVPNEYFLNHHKIQNNDSLGFEDVFIYELLADDSSDLMKTKSNLDFDKVVQHMSQQIYEDFLAVNENGDEIPCVGITHERTFQVRPQERLILYFKRQSDSPIIQIIYTDRLYDVGQVIHTLKEKNIKL